MGGQAYLDAIADFAPFCGSPMVGKLSQMPGFFPLTASGNRVQWMTIQIRVIRVRADGAR